MSALQKHARYGHHLSPLSLPTMSITMQRPFSPATATYYSSPSPPPSPTESNSPPTSFFDHIDPPKKRPAFPPMPAWLSHRSQSSQSTSSHPRISEPFTGDVFGPNARFKAAVSRTLGMGAQVVRTPTDALSPLPTSVHGEIVHEEDESDYDHARCSIDSEHSSIHSAELPPLPLPRRGESPAPARATSPRPARSSPNLHRSITPPKPKRALPPAPAALPALPATQPLATRPNLKMATATTGTTTSPTQSPIELPPLPSFRPISGFIATPPAVSQSAAALHNPPPPPPFSPVLLTPCSNPNSPPTQLLIQVETASSTLTTTMNTLTAVPSRLSEYLTSIIPTVGNASPPPSPGSPFSSAFQAHQEAMGLRASVLPPPHASSSVVSTTASTESSTPSRMHIFLDRPSQPYTHILAFLRSRTGCSTPPVLPRGLLQMPASSAVRMEALFELREEARYLGMVTLERLCEEEITRRQKEREARHAHGHGSRGSSRASVGEMAVNTTIANNNSNSEQQQSSSNGTSGMYIHASKSVDGVHAKTGSIAISHGTVGSRSVDHLPWSPSSYSHHTRQQSSSQFGPMPVTPTSALATRPRSRSVTRGAPPPLSPSGRI